MASYLAIQIVHNSLATFEMTEKITFDTDDSLNREEQR